MTLQSDLPEQLLHVGRPELMDFLAHGGRTLGPGVTSSSFVGGDRGYLAPVNTRLGWRHPRVRAMISFMISLDPP